MILCVSCSNLRDYGNGWVYCEERSIWLHKGYKHCTSHKEGNPPQVQHSGTWSWIERIKESQESQQLRSKETEK